MIFYAADFSTNKVIYATVMKTDVSAGMHLPVKVSVLLLVLSYLEDCLDGLDNPRPEGVGMACNLCPDHGSDLVSPHALVLNLLMKPDL